MGVKMKNKFEKRKQEEKYQHKHVEVKEHIFENGKCQICHNETEVTHYLTVQPLKTERYGFKKSKRVDMCRECLSYAE